MKVPRRAVLTTAGVVAAASLSACSASRGSPSPSPSEPEEPTMTTPSPTGEVAEPSPEHPFPVDSGLVVEDGRVHTPTHTEFVSWDDDGAIVASFTLADPGVEPTALWDLRDGVVAFAGGSDYSVLMVGLDDGRVLGRARVDNDVSRRDDSTVQPPPFKPPRALATDGTHVTAAFSDGTVAVFDVEGDLLHEFAPVGSQPLEGDDPAQIELVYAPDGRLVLGSSSNGYPVQFWEPDGSAPAGELPGSPPHPQHIVFAEDAGRFIVTDHAQGSDEMAWILFDSTTHEPVDEGVLPDVASFVALSPDGATLASAGGFGSWDDVRVIYLTDLATGGTSRMERDGYSARALSFSPDGATLYTHNAAAGIIAWDVASGTPLRSFDLPH